MRHSIAAIAIVFLGTSGSAMAAECNKGLLWPFVRDPGDCLTNTEIKAGQTGVYDGPPATGPVDVSAIKAPVQSPGGAAVECHTSGIWPFRSTECTPPANAAPTTAAVSASPPAAAQPAQSGSPSAALECHTSGIWPFRSTDCTAPAKPAPVTAAAPAPTPAPVPIPAAQPVQPAPQPQAAVVQPAKAVPTPVSADCRKSLLWPFVRDSGDCATTIEKGKSATAVVPVSASEAAAAVPAPAPVVASVPPPTPVVAQSAAAPASAPAASCSKGFLWPFVRDAGDCTTATERSNGAPSAVPVKASATNVTPASGPAAPEATAPQAPAPAGAPAAKTAGDCHKGVLWPFVREPGDCPTDTGRSSGK